MKKRTLLFVNLFLLVIATLPLTGCGSIPGNKLSVRAGNSTAAEIVERLDVINNELLLMEISRGNYPSDKKYNEVWQKLIDNKLKLTDELAAVGSENVQYNYYGVFNTPDEARRLMREAKEFSRPLPKEGDEGVVMLGLINPSKHYRYVIVGPPQLAGKTLEPAGDKEGKDQLQPYPMFTGETKLSYEWENVSTGEKGEQSTVVSISPSRTKPITF